MNFFSYKIEHDYGLAPNPFGGYCTLAVCKSSIRANEHLSVGDWIIGTGSKHIELEHFLIYLMKVEEILTFDQYWEDERFQYKKPVLNGSLVQIYGDNIYHTNKKTKKIIQENSAHSTNDKNTNQEHLERDTGGKNVLVSKTFYYLGDSAKKIPDDFLKICTDSRDMMYKSIDKDFGISFVNWVKNNTQLGINGDPINWKEHIH